jgi:hypothetical protein
MIRHFNNILSTQYVYLPDRKDYTKEYIFRSFWDRDDCYRLLIEILVRFKKSCNDNTAPSGSERAFRLREIPTSAPSPSPTPQSDENAIGEVDPVHTEVSQSVDGSEEIPENSIWKSTFSVGRSAEEEFESGRVH